MKAFDKRTILQAELDSPLGIIYIMLKGQRLVGLSFENEHLRRTAPPEEIARQMGEYFNGNLSVFDLPFDLITGTEFEQSVWIALRDIPYGETRPYKWLAERIGSPKGARAIGQALGKNPLPIILPCHRIVESSGKLGGYTPGTDIKRRLLALEYYNAKG